MSAPVSDETVSRIRRLAAEGMWLAEIARVMGLNRSSVGGICRRHGITTARVRRGPKPGFADAIVPGWVPESLRAEYRDIAREDGEEAAASAIRKLKAEAARC